MPPIAGRNLDPQGSSGPRLSPPYDPLMKYELPIGAFVATALVLLPLPWHWRARNVPTLSIIAWLFVSNIIIGVDSIVWADSIAIRIPVWCDISTKIRIGSNMALPACCLCLCIHLERIASVRQVSTTLNQKHRRMLFDLAMCWGLPLIIMALHYVVQGHRFDVVENIGCLPAIYVSLAAVFILYVPILTVIALTLIFASAALYHFFRRRVTFARHLQDSTSALTPSRYFRLMAMALVQMFWATVVTVVNMVLTLQGGLRPWISWADVHSNFSRVGVFPAIFTPAFIRDPEYFSFWAVPGSVVLFVAFFAFGQDAMKEYRALYASLRRFLRIPPKEPNDKAKKERLASLPAFVARLPARDTKTSVRTYSSSVATASESPKLPPLEFTGDDIPLTPASGTSFATVIAAYDGRDGRDSFYKPPPPHFPADAHDMA
ncbi:Pheromone receptor Rcb2 B44 [Mycena kentingensis (nom. inval.)]|nr:Pheromone receptor Rcb2 B44 [Mycena kentingensis (nom. inval.)]